MTPVLFRAIVCAFVCANIGYGQNAPKISPADAKKLKNPIAYSRKFIADGRTLFARNCVACHGSDAKGQVDVVADDKMAEGLDARGEYVHTPDDLRDTLKRSYQAAAKEGRSTLVNCQALKEFSSAKDYPPGNFMNPEPGAGAFAH